MDLRVFNQTADFLSTVTASSEYFPLILEAQNICINGYKDAKLIDVNEKNEYIWKYEGLTFTYFEMFELMSDDPYKMNH